MPLDGVDGVDHFYRNDSGEDAARVMTGGTGQLALFGAASVLAATGPVDPTQPGHAEAISRPLPS